MGKKFDPEKDDVKKLEVIEADRDDTFIEVKLVSHDGGPDKIQLSRYYEPEDTERKFQRLGRISLDEAAKVRDALTKLIGDAQ